MQRLTKYNLLLSAIRKHIVDDIEIEIMDNMVSFLRCSVFWSEHEAKYQITFFNLQLQIRSVEEFVCSVNTHLTTRQEYERLKGIMARIESYDVVVRKINIKNGRKKNKYQTFL